MFSQSFLESKTPEQMFSGLCGMLKDNFNSENELDMDYEIPTDHLLPFGKSSKDLLQKPRPKKVNDQKWDKFIEIFSGNGAIIQEELVSHKMANRALKYINEVINKIEYVKEYFYIYRCHTCNVILCPDCLGQHSGHEYSIHQKHTSHCECSLQRYELKYFEFIKQQSMIKVKYSASKENSIERNVLELIVEKLCEVLISAEQDVEHQYLMEDLTGLCWSHNIQFIFGYIIFSSINATIDDICNNILEDNLEQLPANESFLTEILTMYDKKVIGEGELFTHPRMVSKLIDTLEYVVLAGKEEQEHDTSANFKNILKNWEEFMILVESLPYLNALESETCIESGIIELYLKHLEEENSDRFYLLEKIENLLFTGTLKDNNKTNNFRAIYCILEHDPMVAVNMLRLYERIMDEYYIDRKWPDQMNPKNQFIESLWFNTCSGMRNTTIGIKYLKQLLTIFGERLPTEVVIAEAKDDETVQGVAAGQRYYKVYISETSYSENKSEASGYKQEGKQLFFTLTEEQYIDIMYATSEIFGLYNRASRMYAMTYLDGFPNLPYVMYFDILSGILLSGDLSIFLEMEIRVPTSSLLVHVKLSKPDQSKESSSETQSLINVATTVAEQPKESLNNSENNVENAKNSLSNNELVLSGNLEQEEYETVSLWEAFLGNGLTWCMNRQSSISGYEEEKRQQVEGGHGPEIDDDVEDQSEEEPDINTYILNMPWMSQIIGSAYFYTIARARNILSKVPARIEFHPDPRIVADALLALQSDLISLFEMNTDTPDALSLATFMYRIDRGIRCAKAVYLKECMCSWYCTDLNILLEAQKILYNREYASISANIDDPNSTYSKFIAALPETLENNENTASFARKIMLEKSSLETILKSNSVAKVTVKIIDLAIQNQNIGGRSLQASNNSYKGTQFSYYAISNNETDASITIPNVIEKIQEYAKVVVNRSHELSKPAMFTVIENLLSLLDMLNYSELLDINLGQHELKIMQALEFFKKYNTIQKLIKMIKDVNCPKCKRCLLDYNIKSVSVCLECYTPYDESCGENCPHTRSLQFHFHSMTINDPKGDGTYSIYLGPYRTQLGECYSEPFDCRQVFTAMGMNCFMLEYISGVTCNENKELSSKQAAMINKRKDYESDETDEFNSNELILYDMEGLANVTDMYS